MRSPAETRQHAAQPLQHRIYLSVRGRPCPARRYRHAPAGMDRYSRRQRRRQDDARSGRMRNLATRCRHRHAVPPFRLLRPECKRASRQCDRFRAHLRRPGRETPPRARHRRRLGLALRHALGRTAEALAGGLRPVGSPRRTRLGRADQPRGRLDEARYVRSAVALRGNRPPRLTRP